MPMPNAEIVHSNGRKCIQDANGRWLYHDHDDNLKYECNLKHVGVSAFSESPSPTKSYGDMLADAMFGAPLFKYVLPGGAENEEELMRQLSDPRYAGNMFMIPNDMGLDVSRPKVPATSEAEWIVSNLTQWLDLFLEKNAKYARVNAVNNLGARGHFPDINRKVGILMDRVWEGNDSPGEPTEEVIDDLIGHLFLMKHDIIKEKEGDDA